MITVAGTWSVSRNVVMTLILAVTTTVCAAGDSRPSPGASRYHMVTLAKQINDAASPVGYWEISLSYPQFEAPLGTELSSVNKQITTLVDQYSCHGSGDQTFTTRSVFSSSHVLSFSYEAMWLCPTMPSPDSVSATVTYNLDSGETVNIRDEFIDDAAKKRFFALANRLLDTRMQTLAPDVTVGCRSIIDPARAVVVETGIEITGMPTTNGEAECQVSVIVPGKKLSDFFKSGSVILK